MARENAKQCDYDYVIGDKVLLCKDGNLRKAETLYDGPYTVTQVHTNGTIRVQHKTFFRRNKYLKSDTISSAQ